MVRITPKRRVDQLISILNVLLQKHRVNIDNESSSTFKIRSYDKMIAIMSDFPDIHISNVKQVEQFFKEKGVKNPQKINTIVTEFLKTGKNTEAIEASKNPIFKSVLNLTKIYAIGPKNAKKLYEEHGIITIADLRNKVKEEPDIINNKMKIGLKYHTQLQKRIPRNEIDNYNEVLQSFCNDISPNLKMSINGSYRRGAETSGDIDILITSTSPGENPSVLRKNLIKKLKQQKIIIETLANGKKKFMGIGKLNKKGFTTPRHIDIIDTKMEEFPFAVLYFTGSGGFNTKMRKIALEKGFSLNEYTISHKTTKVPVQSSEIMTKIGKDKFINEEDIFTFLDMEYVKPVDRNVKTPSKT